MPRDSKGAQQGGRGAPAQHVEELVFCFNYLESPDHEGVCDGLRVRRFGHALLDPPATRDAALSFLQSIHAFDLARLEQPDCQTLERHREAGIRSLEKLQAALA